MSTTNKLFQPIHVGDIQLQHRVVFAPATRLRTDSGYAPLPHVAEYYAQRASTPGTLVISEGTFPAPRAGGFKHTPGIWSEEQILAWKKRQFTPKDRTFTCSCGLSVAPAEEGLSVEGPSDVPMAGTTAPPHALRIDELKEYIQLYATAASNAVHKADFDGVEVHSANGYFLNQFLHDRINVRTDEYGGPSVENRARFPLEVTAAVVKAVGQKKTGFRVSPWGTFNDVYMADPKPTYSYLITELRDRFPELAYLHVVEPRVDGGETVAVIKDGYSNDFIREIWGPRPLISAGGYTPETALEVAEDKGNLIAFARGFIANPDLPYRLLHGIPLNRGTRALYYAPGSVDPAGYTDYPFASVQAN